MTVSIAMGRECDGCRAVRWRPLTSVFVNGYGWRDYCGGCIEAVAPEPAPVRPDPASLVAAWDRISA